MAIPPLAVPICERLDNRAMERFPFVTIIMPVRNEAGFIERSLRAVLDQDYPQGRMEVIIADGMSDDGTRGIIRRVLESRQVGELKDGERATRSNIPVRIIDNPGRIVPTGLNAALREARGDVIIRVDGHALIPHRYVRECIEWLMKTNADCVGGAVRSIGTGCLGRAIARAMSSPFGVGGSRFRTAQADGEVRLTDTVPFGAYRREVFERIGLFNEHMVRHQDYEFNYRLRKAGGRILLLPWLRAEYYVRSTLRGLWRQYWQYGIWKGRFVRAHPDSLKLRHLIPPLFVLAVFIGCVLGLIVPEGELLLEFVLGAYATFLLVATVVLWTGGRVGLRCGLLIPVVLACLHTSYGLGIWYGLFSHKMSAQGQPELTAHHG